jgi:dihydroxyacetone kinase-like protein
MHEALKIGFEQIAKLGKAELGDKTLLDSLGPATDSFKEALDAGKSLEDCLTAATEGAWKGVEATKQMVSKKGRSRYAGERGLGHADAGATSMAYMLEAFATTVKEKACAS